ncbi:MAG: alkaline phosphatase family protein [Phycisphaeraceae bacterium]|nr:alkaline phosphatase family protein [Phycisphaeraceae bacterium]
MTTDTPQRPAHRLLIVGWDAADWKIIDPLLAQGGMANLRALIDSGLRADLRSLDPKLSPLLWTSIATGKTADKHGVLNFVEPDTASHALRPVCSTTRRTKALWNILTQSGLRTNLVAWYASHPAEPIRGGVVSNLFLEGLPATPNDPWPLPPGSVHPPDLAPRIADLRIHPAEILPDELAALVPDIASIPASDPRPALLSKLLAQAASVHNAATTLLESDPDWHCSMIFHELIDVVGHHFMQYYPPRMPHVSERDFALFQRVIPAVYQLQDAMLGRLLELAGPQTTVIVLSDHGFHSDHLRPHVQAALNDPHAAMDATWHRPHGMLVMAGPAVRPAAQVHGATLLDVAPTALTLLGVPVGADMDGRVLVEALDRPPDAPIDRVFSWDALPGEAGQHPPDLRVDPFEARDALKQLEDLGYTAPAPESAREHLALCDRETRFNLGVVYITTARRREAAEVFGRLHAEHPDEPRFALNHAHCLYALGRHAETLTILDKLAGRFPDQPDTLFLKSAALFVQGRAADAAAALERAAAQAPHRPDLLCALADAYTQLQRWPDAEQILDRAAALDPHDPMVPFRRARLELARNRFEQAAEHALTAVELRHFFPEAHYTLGVALTWMKDYPHAIQSFKVALSMQPGMVDAHRFIASIFRHLNDRASARPHREAAEALLAARASGDAPPAHLAAATEPPLGPQDWARQLGLADSDSDSDND